MFKRDICLSSRRSYIASNLSFLAMILVMMIVLTAGSASFANESPANAASDDAEVIVSADMAVPSEDLPPKDAEEAEKKAVTPDALPEIYRVSIGLLNQSDRAGIDALSSSLATLVAENNARAAAMALGEVLGRERKGSAAFLGFYCSAVLPYLSGSQEEEADFLSGLLSGYGKAGLLMITHDGVEKIYAYGNRRGTPWKVVKEPSASAPSDKYARIYRGAKTTYIPFSNGEIFKVDIYGAPAGTAKVWKILPKGTNSKSWTGGMWEREITVRGDKIY